MPVRALLQEAGRAEDVAVEDARRGAGRRRASRVGRSEEGDDGSSDRAPRDASGPNRSRRRRGRGRGAPRARRDRGPRRGRERAGRRAAAPRAAIASSPGPDDERRRGAPRPRDGRREAAPALRGPALGPGERRAGREQRPSGADPVERPAALERATPPRAARLRAGSTSRGGSRSGSIPRDCEQRVVVAELMARRRAAAAARASGARRGGRSRIRSARGRRARKAASAERKEFGQEPGLVEPSAPRARARPPRELPRADDHVRAPCRAEDGGRRRGRASTSSAVVRGRAARERAQKGIAMTASPSQLGATTTRVRVISFQFSVDFRSSPVRTEAETDN